MQENGGFFNNKNEKNKQKPPRGGKTDRHKITAVRADIPYHDVNNRSHRTGDTWRIYGRQTRRHR